MRTYEEIGKTLKITKQAALNAEKKALKKMLKFLNTKYNIPPYECILELAKLLNIDPDYIWEKLDKNDQKKIRDYVSTM